MLNTFNQNQEPLTCPPSDTMMKEVRTDGTEINEIYLNLWLPMKIPICCNNLVYAAQFQQKWTEIWNYKWRFNFVNKVYLLITLMSLIELTEVNKYSPLFPKGASTLNRRFHSKTGLNLLRSLTKDIKGKSKYAMVKGFSTYSGSDMTII